ncbi:hypothetical protein HDU82_003266 [Entophlyctis luteolus]|nr:hypothetical protein HDU82_003266 [Entophlyctis luteolus]
MSDPGLEKNSIFLRKYLDPIFAANPIQEVGICIELISTYRLLRIMVALQVGDRKSAFADLETLSAVVGHPTKLPYSENNLSALNSATNTFPASISFPGADAIINVLSGEQRDALMYLVAGVILRDNDTSRAILYLNEGIKRSEGKILTNLTCRVFDDLVWDLICTNNSIPGKILSNWEFEHQIISSHFLVESFLLKGDTTNAEQIFNSMISRIQSQTNAFSTRISEYESQHTKVVTLAPHLAMILLDAALICHAKGDPRKASRYYFGAAAVAAELSRLQGNAGDDSMQAILHETRAHFLLEELERDFDETVAPFSQHSTSLGGCEHVKAFLNLSKALIAYSDREIKKTKYLSLF